MIKCEHWETEPINGRDLYFYFPDGTEAGFLCEDCQFTMGFCNHCGLFVRGVEQDEQVFNTYGVCADCFSQIVEEAFIEPELLEGLDDVG